VIDTTTALAHLVASVDELARVGVDTEADSLHCYQEKVCLIQVGLPDADELVDPLAGVDLAPLMEALSRTEIVLHGADFDLRMLYRAGLGAPGSVFDTMMAARLTGAAKFGYSALVADYFDVALPKGSQKANWANRPLSPKMEQYARNDTHYLLPLADALEQRLRELGRLDWLRQSCARAVDAARVVRERDPETEWRVRGSHALGPRAGAVLRALWLWREEEARAADRPPFHVLSNEELVDSARRFDRGEPVSLRRLRGGRPERFARVADEALRLDRSAWPTRPRPAPRPRKTREQQQRFDELKRRRDRTARDLAIDADLIAPRAALERIAADATDGMAALLPWQRALLDGAA